LILGKSEVISWKSQNDTTIEGVVASPASAKDELRVPTIDDLLNIDSIGGARISPNGKWVAYSVTHSDFRKDAFLTHLWIADPASGRKYQLTRGDKSAGDLDWSPDGAWLAFTSNRAGDKNQVFARTFARGGR
jgi:dipeptidyl aminopeptidase/acylaminoacyl peptidase